MGAGSIEYWKWNDQKLGEDDQKRSRNEGSATSTSGEARGRRANARNDPAHTRTLAGALNRSLTTSTGCCTTYAAALAGPAPNAR